MANVSVITQTFNGAADGSPAVILHEDYHRKYFALYAAGGTCYFSMGVPGHDHEYAKIALGEGVYFEARLNLLCEVQYSGVGTSIRVIREGNESFENVLTYDGVPLTYMGKPINYHA